MEPFLLLIGATFAGLLGSLSGLGGGAIVVPLLILGFGVDVHYAIGASLIAVIATSCGSSIRFLNEGLVNVRLGLLLETATTVGALFGAFLTLIFPKQATQILFGCVLLYASLSSYLLKPKPATAPEPNTPDFFQINGKGAHPYAVHHLMAGYAVMFAAGVLSALLGIGSGAVKVLAFDQIMRTPFKVSTTTSNFMIGVTAAASTAAFLKLGYLSPTLIVPLVPGVVAGSLLGSALLSRIHTKHLRLLFTLIVVGLAAKMIASGLYE